MGGSAEMGEHALLQQTGGQQLVREALGGNEAEIGANKRGGDELPKKANQNDNDKLETVKLESTGSMT